MKRILIVKATSLGDIILCQPVVSDLHYAFPGVKIDWAVDAAFTDIPQWNSGIDHVLSAPLRAFKKDRSLTQFKAIFHSIKDLRREKYDLILDLQGVYKSAIISFLARSSRRIGYCNKDLGERGAAFAYNERFSPRKGLKVWDGMRTIVSEKLNYQLNGEPQFNLSIPNSTFFSAELDNAKPFAVLCHATSKDEKKWLPTNWVFICQELIQRGITPMLPWGNEKEKQEAIAITNEVKKNSEASKVSGANKNNEVIKGARVLPKLTIAQIAQYLNAAHLIVGMDTGLVHLASALHKPTVMLFNSTDPASCGIDIPGLSISVGEAKRIPSVDEVLSAILTLI